MYEYHQTKHGGFRLRALQSIINSVCRLRAYYEAWLEFGASSNINCSHFMNSWHGVLDLSTTILEVREFDTFDPIFEELTAAFADVEYSTVDVTDITITGEAQLEKMFGDELWAKANPAQKAKRAKVVQEIEPDQDMLAAEEN